MYLKTVVCKLACWQPSHKKCRCILFCNFVWLMARFFSWCCWWLLCLCCVALDSDERLTEMKRILTEELPADNYFVLKYIVHFLTEVHCYYYPHMPIGKVWIYRSLFVCLFFVCILCGCTVTDFSAEDKASDVTFYTAVYRRPRQGITNFCELCSQHRTNRRARGTRPPACKHYRRDAPT